MRIALLIAAFCSSSALAAPRFTADVPAHADLAKRAWSAAIDCTGWEANAHPHVLISAGVVGDGFDGGAYVDDAGLYRVEVGIVLPARHLVHEVAHAWAHSGPSTLTEGRTDLLADCMASRMGQGVPLDPDEGRALDNLPDLRTWSNPHDDHHATDLDDTRRDAYLGSARLLRVLARVLEPRGLWPEGGHLGWDQLRAALEEAGPAGATVLAVLDGGVDAQRAALSDRDRDGVPWLGEVLQGTNPEQWDSDGDGWWDGALPHSVAALPLPIDGTPVCSGFAAGGDGATVHVLYQGEHRAHEPPRVRVIAGDTLIEDDPSRGVFVPAGKPIMLAMDGGLRQATGGTWAMAGGFGLVTDWNCRSTPAFTVWVASPRAATILDDFATTLAEHMHRADGLLGTSPRRVVVALGSDHTGMVDGEVHLSKGLISWTLQEHRNDALAGLAVALHRTWHGDEDARRWDNAEALTRTLVDDPPATLFVAIDRQVTDDRDQAVAACPDGWEGMLDGRCERSDGAADAADAPAPKKKRRKRKR